MGKILIVGGSGFIGYHLQRELRDRPVVNMDLQAPDFASSAEFRRGDIRNPTDLQRVIVPGEFEVIINLAAEHKDFGVTRQQYFETNETGTRNLLDAAVRAQVDNIVFYSSVAVYGDNATPSHEQLTPAPGNFYGASKLAAERALQQWAAADSRRRVVILRPTVVYGERNFANVYRLIRQIKSGLYFTLSGGSNVKSMAYVRNLVAATVYLMDNVQTGVHIFNYADEPHLTTKEISDCIAGALGRRQPISLPYRMVHTLVLPFDLLIRLTGRDLPVSTNRVKKLCTPTHHRADKLRAVGFRPAFDNRQGLANMVTWMEQGARIDP